MSKPLKMLPIVRQVGEAFLPVESAVDSAAAAAHRAVAVMIEQRKQVGKGANYGAAALTLASKGADHLTAAAICFGGAHKELADLLGDAGFGPQCPIGTLREPQAE